MHSISVTLIPLSSRKSLSCLSVAALETPEATRLTLAARSWVWLSFPNLAFPYNRFDCFLGRKGGWFCPGPGGWLLFLRVPAAIALAYVGLLSTTGAIPAGWKGG